MLAGVISDLSNIQATDQQETPPMSDTLTPAYADTDLRLGLRAIPAAYREEFDSDDGVELLSDLEILADFFAATLEVILTHYLPADVSALDVAAAMHAHTFCGEDVIPSALLPALLRGIRARREELAPEAGAFIAEYKARHDG